MADESNDQHAAAERDFELAKAAANYSSAREDLQANLMTEVKTEVFLDEAAVKWAQNGIRDDELLIQHGETPVSATFDFDAPLRLVEELKDQSRQLDEEVKDAETRAHELDARFAEIMSQPAESRDLDELRDLAKQMNELVDRNADQWDSHVREAREHLGPETEAVLHAEAELRESYVVQEQAADQLSHEPGHEPVIDALPDHSDAAPATPWFTLEPGPEARASAPEDVVAMNLGELSPIIDAGQVMQVVGPEGMRVMVEAVEQLHPESIIDALPDVFRAPQNSLEELKGQKALDEVNRALQDLLHPEAAVPEPAAGADLHVSDAAEHDPSSAVSEHSDTAHADVSHAVDDASAAASAHDYSMDASVDTTAN